jgi:hypothetical protein
MTILSPISGAGKSGTMKMKLLPHVEGNSIRNAMLTDGDIAILQKISIDKVKNGIFRVNRRAS